MSTTQSPEAPRSLYDITGKIGDVNTLLISQDALNTLHAEVAHKEKYAEQLGRELAKADTETRTLRAGYDAARLEIDSLRARSVASASEYPPLPTRPEPDGFLTIKILGRDVEVNAYRDSTMEAFARAAVDADRAMRAAQPAGAANTRALENVALLADILNRRPAINAGLVEAYAHWTREVYDLMGAMAAEPANDSDERQRAIMKAERNASLDAYSRVVYLTGAESRLFEAGFTNGWKRASHRQAPAQAAPAAPPAPNGWSFDVKRSDGRVWLTISTPHGASAALSAAEKTGNGDDTIVAQVLDYLADSLVAPAAVAGPSDWRELAAKVMNALADAQEQTNAAYPAHVSCYPGWEAQARWLRWHADMFRTGKPAGNGAGHPAVLAALAAAPTTQPAPMESVLIDGIAYPTPAPVAAELLRLHIEARQPSPQQEAQEPVWDGKLSDATRKVLNDLYLQCGHETAGAVSFQVRKECEALYTSLLTAKRMYHAAQQKLEALEAAPQPSPASQVDALDAARYRWLADMNDWYAEPRLDEAEGTKWQLTFYSPQRIEDAMDDDSLDVAVDAARKQGENHD